MDNIILSNRFERYVNFDSSKLDDVEGDILTSLRDM